MYVTPTCNLITFFIYLFIYFIIYLFYFYFYFSSSVPGKCGGGRRECQQRGGSAEGTGGALLAKGPLPVCAGGKEYHQCAPSEPFVCGPRVSVT